MVIKVPENKRADILKILTKMIQKRKATSLGLQSLTGKFLCKAVPTVKPFIQRIYQTFPGLPQHRHIDLKGEVLAEMHMWKSFLY